MKFENAIKRTIGNYMDYTNRSFPLDCDGMDNIQKNFELLSVLGNIGGDKYILAGCTEATAYAGYVFLATQKYPNGELLYVHPGKKTNILYVKEENETITVDNYNYSKAYTMRTMYFGTDGNEGYNFSEFTQIKTNKELQAEIEQLDKTVRSFTPELVGSIKMWPQMLPPVNWLKCDGALYKTSDYPELAELLGKGNSDTFNVPNLAGRFPVGQSGDSEFQTMGQQGGDKTHKLSENELPSHCHIQRVSPENGNYGKLRGYRVATDPGNDIPTSNNDNMKIVDWEIEGGYVYTGATGGNQPHNNLPPYTTLQFIIRAK